MDTKATSKAFMPAKNNQIILAAKQIAFGSLKWLDLSLELLARRVPNVPFMDDELITI